MKKLLLSALLLNFYLSSNAQITVFEDSFETYTNFAIDNVGNWTLTNMDNNVYNYGIDIGNNQTADFLNSGEIPAYIVFNPSATTPVLTPNIPEYQAKTGDKYMAAFASLDANENPVTQSDWLISPKMTLGTDNVVTFWAKQVTNQYGNEKFKVLISDSSAATTSFTALSQGTHVELNGINWTQYTYNVPSSYDLKDVYVAIQCVSYDSFIFMIDDFKVTAQTLSSAQFFNENLNVYPNPATDVLNIESNNNIEIKSVTITDLQGRKIKTITKTTSSIIINDLSSGTYLLDIITNKGNGTTKFIKK